MRRLLGKRGGLYLLLGGIFTIMAGILSIVNGLVVVIEDKVPLKSIFTFFTIYTCSPILVVFGIVAIASGVHVILKRPSIVIASIGAFLGILGGGFYGFWLGITAIFLFWLSDEDL